MMTLGIEGLIPTRRRQHAPAGDGRMVSATSCADPQSCLVTLRLREFPGDPAVRERLPAMRPPRVKTYGVLLGLTAATAILVGDIFAIPYDLLGAAIALFYGPLVAWVLARTYFSPRAERTTESAGV
jgi:hypothetical protein